MQITGVRQTSLIDYAGQIVTTLFTQGCNLRCSYCHNSELIDSCAEDKSAFNLDDILNFIWGRRELIDGVCITGGEPTLQRGLDDFIAEIKDMELKVKLDTNGTQPQVITQLIKNELLDYIAMDVKGAADNLDFIGLNDEKIESYRQSVKESINLIMNAAIEYEFRTTVVPGIHTKSDIKDITEKIKEADKYYIQNFTANNPLDSKFEETRSFSDDELIEFKKIADFYVNQVEIRG